MVKHDCLLLLSKMFLHPFCHSLTGHRTVACESQKKCQTPQISSNGAFSLVSLFFCFFLKEGSITGSVTKAAAKDTNKP